MSGPKDGEIEPIYREVGRRITRLRRRQGLTQDALAKKTGLARTSIASIERGEQRFLLHYLFALAGGLGVPVNRLLPQEPLDLERRISNMISEISTEDPQAAVMIKEGLAKLEKRP